MNNRARLLVVLAALTVSTFAFVTTETLPIGLLPRIARELRVAPATVGILVTVYALTVVVATIPLTRLTSRVPRRALMSVLLAVFVVGNLATAIGQGFAVLVVARIATALAQAVFWAIVLAVAAGLVARERRGRAVSAVYAGGSAATVLGVPVGTWLGDVVDWRAAFLAMSAIGIVALLVVATLTPRAGAEGSAVERASDPSRQRYVLLIAITVLTVTAAFTSLTYVAAYLIDAVGTAPAAVAGVLLLRGVVGLGGVIGVGAVVDRFPESTMLVIGVAQVAALVAQGLAPSVAWIAIPAVLVSGAVVAALSAALGARLLVVAPGRVETASAISSTAFNVGIMLGSLVGGVLLPAIGASGLSLAAAAIGVVAVILIAADARVARSAQTAAVCT